MFRSSATFGSLNESVLTEAVVSGDMMVVVQRVPSVRLVVYDTSIGMATGRTIRDLELAEPGLSGERSRLVSADADAIVLLPAERKQGEHLRAVDPRTGEELWTKDPEEATVSAGRTVRPLGRSTVSTMPGLMDC